MDECSKCGICCINKQIMLTDIEARRISEGINKSINKFAKIEGLFLILKQRQDKKCIFLGNNNWCKIYFFRPAQCRSYPILYNQLALENPNCIINDNELIFRCEKGYERC